MLFRNIISTVVILAYTNKGIKNAMYDSIPNNQFCNIVLRIVQGLITKSINFYSFKYWKITTIAMFVSLVPIFTMIFGILILGEKVNRSDIY